MPELSRFLGMIISIYFMEWADLHKTELMDNWNSVKENGKFTKIAPLV